MMRPHPLQLCLLLVLFIAIGVAASAPPKPRAWITVADPAYRHIRALIPDATSVASRQFAIAGGSERVHAVVLDEARFDAVAGIIHQRLGQCGGFMLHASEAEARAALDWRPLDSPPLAYAIRQHAVVEPLLAGMATDGIASTILTLSAYTNRYYTSPSGVDASNWLLSAWRELATGRADIAVRQLAHKGYPQASVILTIAGTDLADEHIVVGAHLDSILAFRMGETARAPGADDDASGVASMTEAVRALIRSGYRPRRTIHVMAYAAEEVGLRGSQEIARQFKAAGRKVVGVLQLDMTNYKGAAKDIYLISDYTNAAQNAFLAELAAAYLLDLKVGHDKCGYACSDHASWTAQGYPSSMPFESSLARDNPNIHTARDTLANAGGQADHALKFARLAAAYMVELSGE